MRHWPKVLLTMLILVVLLFSAGYWYWQKTLQTLAIHNLQFGIKTLSLHQLQLKHLSFELEQPAVKAELNDLVIRWHFPSLFRPTLQQISLGSGKVILTQWPRSAPDKDPLAELNYSLPSNWQIPTQFPKQIDIKQLMLSLPCPAGQCDYLLAAQLQIAEQHLRYQLYGYDAANADILRLNLQGDYQTVQGLPLLNSQLTFDDSISLNLAQTLSQQVGKQPELLHTSGNITLQIAPPSPWLLQQISAWQLELPADAVAQFTAPVTLNSDWQFDLPKQLDLISISQQASGNGQLTLHLPSPLSVPGIGQLQGQLQLEIGLSDGELSLYKLNSELALLQPILPDALQQKGIQADIVNIRLYADGKTKPQFTALPVQVSISSQGATNISFNSAAIINLIPPLSATLQHSELALQQQTFTPTPQTRLEQLSLHSQFTANWLDDSWQLDIKTAQLILQHLSVNDISAKTIQLDISPSKFNGDSQFHRIDFKSQIALTLGSIKQTELLTQSWQWQADISGKLDLTTASQHALTVNGALSNHANLGINHQLEYQNKQLELNWQLDEMFLLAGNPLMASFTSWPALLEFSRGRMNASGSLHYTDSLKAQANLNLSGISGIYDRSLFKDLSAELNLNYDANEITLTTENTTLKEIDHGVVVGPLKLAAQYHALASAPVAGKLTVTQLLLQAMGGQITVQPVTLDLTKEQQEVILQLSQINLAKLLQQHPTTDLTGNGRISGTVPLLINRSGATIKNGHIAAESPGGELQYRPTGAENMAAGNSGMKVVLDALNDFHYSVLASDVSYNNQGQLILTLNLQGSNPALEGGRAINLNINLEEDIPALITSLQLSSKISDKIKQRVQQRIQQSSANRANGAKP
ncbi:intermembrane phospholipid transport protein YdbH family protein [Rheinheimera metallidurans]|uniref:intermembrane phospholipid transport protein YdbH family protein n=1 Tax=Rheinheimera metallidurans TaxID=2925781 RepID=UPI0030036217